MPSAVQQYLQMLFFTALSDCVKQAGGDVSILKSIEIEKAEPKLRR